MGGGNCFTRFRPKSGRHYREYDSPTTGGNTIAVLGSGFTAATAVTVGGVSADFTVESDNAIAVTVPTGTAGTVDVVVTTPSGTSTIVTADQYVYTNVTAPAPAITSVSPSSGSSSGGQAVLITGTNFSGTTAVSFGGTAATSWTLLSDSEMEAVAPAGSVGTVDITVTTNNGTSSTGSSDQFTYVSASVPAVSSLGTSTGTTAGGTSVAITGTGFTGATAVLFGGVAASYTVNSDTSITATAPPQYAGIVDITVTTAAGTSATSSNDQFTYTNAAVPVLTGLSSGSGTTAGGTSITLTGTGFTGAIAVTFGSVAAPSFTVNSDTSITATVPAQYAGTYDVSVTTYSGTAALSSADRYQYTLAAMPAVTGLSTQSTTTAGGAVLTVTGTSFTGATAVTVGGVDASDFTVNSDTSLSVTVPPMYAGTYDIQVTTYSGTSAANSSDQLTYSNAAAPAVTGLSSGSGSTGGGAVITVTGAGFTGATGVAFGSVDAPDFTVNSDTSISVTVPPQAAGTVDVTVTTYSGTSSTSPSDQYTYSNAAIPAVTGLSSTSGSAAGGNVVVVSGSGFTGASSVAFGTTTADDYTVLSDNALLVTVPSGSVGTVDVTVTTPSGTSTTNSSDHYQYTSVTVPAITSMSPASGGSGGGTQITITGTGFTNATAVDFGGVAAPFWVDSDTSITAIAPPEGSGTVDVTITVPGAVSAYTAADQFSYTADAAPVVTSLSTSSGSTAGGTTVTVNGSNFLGATQVTFGGVAATIVSDSSSSITVLSPS